MVIVNLDFKVFVLPFIYFQSCWNADSDWLQPLSHIQARPRLKFERGHGFEPWDSVEFVPMLLISLYVLALIGISQIPGRKQEQNWGSRAICMKRILRFKVSKSNRSLRLFMWTAQKPILKFPLKNNISHAFTNLKHQFHMQSVQPSQRHASWLVRTW